ncbi:ArsR/SmtB family transcription factor [Corynebacterium sp. NPDC060344]|uniref:ArsR/SmtB family transcription factor n=1 Tax=Corynebacterium sp. NPDC060344 TaxID=3347101 RepID=UPI00366019AF
MSRFPRAVDKQDEDQGPDEADYCEESGHATSLAPDSPYIDVAVEVFSMLADMTRVKIILALRDGELPVGELAVRVGKTPTSVSQHLAKLRMARMVRARQEGTRVFYSLVDEHAATLVVQAIYQAEHATDGDPHPPRWCR